MSCGSRSFCRLPYFVSEFNIWILKLGCVFVTVLKLQGKMKHIRCSSPRRCHPIVASTRALPTTVEGAHSAWSLSQSKVSVGTRPASFSSIRPFILRIEWSLFF